MESVWAMTGRCIVCGVSVGIHIVGMRWVDGSDVDMHGRLFAVLSCFKMLLFYFLSVLMV